MGAKSICFSGQSVSCRYQDRHQLNILSNLFWTNCARACLSRFGGSFTFNTSFGPPYIGEGILILHTQASSGRPVEYINVQRTAQMGSLKPFIERDFFCFSITIVILGHLYGTMHVGTRKLVEIQTTWTTRNSE